MSESLEFPLDSSVSHTDRAGENYAKILTVMENALFENISVSELAKRCEMSIPALEKTMYQYLRCGAMSYYNDLRMNQAHDLLSRGESVKSTALLLNYSTQNYFSTSFRRHFGYPPSHVKKQ